MRKGIRCTVNLYIREVTCPGVWLSEGATFLAISIWGRRFCSADVPPIFPLGFYQKFTFTKTYVNFCSILDVCKAQLDEFIVIELWQRDPICASSNLATYKNKLAEFLFPAPHLSPSYSNSFKEVLLRPSLCYPGIIGPKLEFSTNTIFEEMVDCCHCNDAWTVQRHFDNIERGRTPKRFSSMTVNSESVDRRPFVVRKVDEKLFSRVPSLYQCFPKKCSYCCKSPHRHSNCAACRHQRTQSPSPARLRTARNRSCTKSDNFCAYCKHEVRHLKSDCKWCDAASESPRRVANVNQEPILISPRINVDKTHLSSNASTADDIRSPEIVKPKSSLIDRPSYQERFGSSPINNHFNYKSIADDFDDEPVLEKEKDKVSDEHSCCYRNHHNCCHCHLEHLSPHLDCSHNCGSYECPLFWRYRFGSPYSFYNWRSFHRGLASVYDDLYKDYL
ncbi:spermatoproteinsis associated [Chamberlinius hualienensis]